VEVGSHLHTGVRHGAKLEHYAKIFVEGLTEEQARMIDELFMDYVPAPEVAKVLVDEEV
jgi:hypothetical protein